MADIKIELNHQYTAEALQHLSQASALSSRELYFSVRGEPAVSQTKVTWPLPDLRELDLYLADLSVKDFREFVWDRWGAYDKAQAQREARLKVMERPTTLDTLKLPSDLIDKVNKALKHALGQCDCYDI